MRGPAVVPRDRGRPGAADRRGSASTTSRSASSTDIDERWQDRARPGGVRRRGRAADPRRLGLAARVPLSSLVRGTRGCTPTRLVLFRRPIEHRCETRTDLEAMVLTVVVEQVAELLGIDAEQVDPRYDAGDAD